MSQRARAILLPLLVICSLIPGGRAWAQTHEWQPPGGGSWNTAGNWFPAAVPSAAGDTVLVDSTGAGEIFMDLNPTVDAVTLLNPLNILNVSGRTLTLLQPGGLFTAGRIRTTSNANLFGNLQFDTGSEMDIDAGATLSLSGPLVVNDGTIHVNVNGSAVNATLRANDPVVFSGTGEIVLMTNGAGDLLDASLTGLAGADTVTNGPSHTIRGDGTVSVNLVNQGTVLGDAPGLVLQVNGVAKINEGSMRAENGGTLQLASVVVTQTASGELYADGGDVDLSSATVSGGTLRSSGVNAVRHVAGTTTLANLTNEGEYHILPGMVTQTLGGTLVNQGSIRINPTGGSGNSVFRANDPLLLTGTGDLFLSTGGLDGYDAQLTSLSSADTLTQDAGHTIRGEGVLSANLTNHGLVSADVSGRGLYLTSQPKRNHATLEATADGILHLSTVVTQVGSGEISANGGTVQLATATVSGGMLSSVSPHTVDHVSGTVTLDNVTNEGEYRILSGLVTQLLGGVVTNNGTIRVNPTMGTGNSVLRANDPVLLTGNGDVVLTTSGADGNDAQLTSLSSVDTLTQDGGHTIRGEGVLYANLINHGLVSADVSGRALYVASQPKRNHATLEATGDGILHLSTVVTQVGGGEVFANGGTVQLATATVSGGTLRSLSPYTVDHVSGTATLDNVTNEGEYRILPGMTTQVLGGALTNNGTIRINPTGGSGNSTFRANDPVLLSGSGEFVLATSGVDGNDAQLTSLASVDTVTQSANHTIRGEGVLYATLVNDGTMLADVVNRTLWASSNPKVNRNTMRAELGGLLQATTTVLNTGAVSATDSAQVLITSGAFDNDGVVGADGGTVHVSSTLYDNHDGISESRNGGLFRASTLNQHYGANTLTGGRWEIFAGSVMRLIGADIVENRASILFDGVGSELYRDDAAAEALAGFVLNHGSFTVQNGRDYVLASGFENRGAVTSGPGSILTATGDYLQTNGTTTVQGTLTATSDTVRIVDGVLEGTGVVDAEVILGGTASPGTSVGALTVDGSYAQAADAALRIEINGTGLTEVDRLDVTGHATLAGAVVAEVPGSYVASAGDEFLVMTFASRTGTFDAVLNCPWPGLCLEAEYSDTTVILRAVVPNILDAGDPDPSLPLHPAFAARLLRGGSIRFDLELPGSAEVRLDVFDVAGRRVATVVDGTRPAGRHEVAWTPIGDSGARLGSGVYFGRMVLFSEGRREVLTGKVVLVR